MTASGYGHFTTMQVRRRAVQGLPLHVQRLADATRELFDCGLDLGAVSKAIIAALDGAGVDDATVRVTVSAATTLASTGSTAQCVPRIDVSVSAPLVHADAPMRLVPVVHQRVLPHIKHVGTFASHHYRRCALRAGVEDALFIGADGRVLEGTFWNIGFWRADAVVWPDAPALRGTGERLLREGLVVAGIRQSVETIHVDTLAGLDGAFIVNARGVRAVQAIGDVDWMLTEGSGVAHLRQLLAAVPWDALAD